MDHKMQKHAKIPKDIFPRKEYSRYLGCNNQIDRLGLPVARDGEHGVNPLESQIRTPRCILSLSVVATQPRVI